MVDRAFLIEAAEDNAWVQYHRNKHVLEEVYREWCLRRGLDHEDVDSAVAYEAWVSEREGEWGA